MSKKLSKRYKKLLDLSKDKKSETLEEAIKRRTDETNEHQNRSKEFKGRGGLEPTRFGDWEVKGIASDF